MKTATLVEIKKELKYKTAEELVQLCARLARFKKENKELLTYLLFEADNEEHYITNIKALIDTSFQDIKASNWYYIKKKVRKILKETKKYIRYSGIKETEVELLLYFCDQLKSLTPAIKRNTTLTNLFERQLLYIEKKIPSLHEDLQYDFTLELEELKQ